MSLSIILNTAYMNVNIHLNVYFHVRHIRYLWFLLFIKIVFSLPQTEMYQTAIYNDNNAENNTPKIIEPFPYYGKILCQCSKLTSKVVCRLWFSMLVQNALSMYWDSFNFYVNCLHMWLLYVISLHLYVFVTKYVSIMLDFAGHSWMT